jgi:hypothetical protein
VRSSWWIRHPAQPQWLADDPKKYSYYACKAGYHQVYVVVVAQDYNNVHATDPVAFKHSAMSGEPVGAQIREELLYALNATNNKLEKQTRFHYNHFVLSFPEEWEVTVEEVFPDCGKEEKLDTCPLDTTYFHKSEENVVNTNHEVYWLIAAKPNTNDSYKISKLDSVKRATAEASKYGFGIMPATNSFDYRSHYRNQQAQMQRTHQQYQHMQQQVQFAQQQAADAQRAAAMMSAAAQAQQHMNPPHVPSSGVPPIPMATPSESMPPPAPSTVLPVAMPPQASSTASVPAAANPFDSASVAPSVAAAPSMAYGGGLASTVTVDGTSSVTGSSNPRTANANAMQQLFAAQHAVGGSGPFQFVPPVIPETVDEDSAASSSDMSMSFSTRGRGQ